MKTSHLLIVLSVIFFTVLNLDFMMIRKKEDELFDLSSYVSTLLHQSGNYSRELDQLLKEKQTRFICLDNCQYRLFEPFSYQLEQDLELHLFKEKKMITISQTIILGIIY